MDKYLLKTKVVETEEQKHAREKREERIKYVNENIFYNKSFRSMQKVMKCFDLFCILLLYRF